MNAETSAIRVLPGSSPISAQVISLGEVHGTPGPRTDGVAAVTANPLHAVRTQLQVRIGTVSLTVGQLLEAREGEVLVLDRAVEEDIDLLIEGGQEVVARGRLVAIDGRFGIRITELPVALTP